MRRKARLELRRVQTDLSGWGIVATRESLDKFVKAQPATTAEGHAEEHLAEQLRQNRNMSRGEKQERVC